MRKKIVAGNWKMHGTTASVEQLLTGIINNQDADIRRQGIDVIVFPPYVFLPQAKALLSDTSIQWGAQNLATEDDGAYTGEISATMLQDLACQYVLVGHSERRQLFAESDAMVAEKFIKAQSVGLTPILCVGETLQQREQNLTEQVILAQLDAVIDLCGNIDAFAQAVIAYEPVWAIGTGKTATPEQAQAIHATIRQYLEQHSVKIANNIAILYGGSVKADNAAELFAMPDIDGGLIGGASLKVNDFTAIVNAIV